MREHVLSGTGLTIGVGMGPTKTLAKSAQWASKEWSQFGGVLALTAGSPKRTVKLLSLQPVEEIWGIGRHIGKKLNTYGVKTALQLAHMTPAFVRKNFTVVLKRTVRELNGEACISLEEAPPAKQQIVCSRSFGKRITTYESPRQAICQFAERAAEKLRGGETVLPARIGLYQNLPFRRQRSVLRQSGQRKATPSHPRRYP